MDCQPSPNVPEDDSLNDVLQYYQAIGLKNESIFDINIFMKQDLSVIKRWLGVQFDRKIIKNESTSTKYRKQGNSFYAKKKIKQSLQCYMKSLCYAKNDTEEINLAMGNRSAVTYEMGKYEDCLKDIDSCLGSSYPEHLRSKLLLRKAQCLKLLRRHQDLLVFLEEASEFSVSSSVTDQEKYIEKLKHLRIEDLETKISNNILKDVDKFPELENGENLEFAYASSKIEMRYNSEKGRHVVAKQDISKGDVLFVEKAFAFGSIFDVETKDINLEKCYYCLKHILSGIPCNSCVRCVFCDETCRNLCWEESHRWACNGMQTNMWYHLGIAFPAFKTVVKGIGSDTTEEVTNNTKRFGNKHNNYPYFDSLVYHVRERDIETLVCSAITVKYLTDYTDFFPWYLTQTNCPENDLKSLINNVGNRLVKHIRQLENNSSIIEHWVEAEANTLPTAKEPVACGIFPSVSIMNHSCRPNITNFFIQDTIVVKALEDIKENDEILNCYGIDYRTMNKEDRQMHCLELYNFKCRCVICSDPTREMENFDAFICPDCGHNIPNVLSLTFTYCQQCNTKIYYHQLREINENAEELLQDENNENKMLNSLECRKKVLCAKHSDLQNTYDKLYRFYKSKGDCQNLLKYFDKWIRNEKNRIGDSAQKFGPILYEVGNFIKKSLRPDEHFKIQRTLLKQAELFLQESKVICSLYYPHHVIETLSWE